MSSPPEKIFPKNLFLVIDFFLTKITSSFTWLVRGCVHIWEASAAHNLSKLDYTIDDLL